MTAAPIRPRPLVRAGQRWLFKGQRWRIHQILDEGVIVLMGPSTMRNLEGVTAEELYEAGLLEHEAPAVDKATERMAKAFEQAQEQLKHPKRKRPKKPPPPPAPKAWACRLLAVDVGATSGWAIWQDGVLRSWGELSKDDDAGLLGLCTHALLGGRADPARVVLVLEKHAGIVYGGHSAATLLGLGAAREAWEHAWRSAGGMKTRVARFKPTRWRSMLFGRTRNTFELERQFAELSIREGQHAPDEVGYIPAGVPGPDARAAICIGRCAAYSGEVGNALPRFLRVAV